MKIKSIKLKNFRGAREEVSLKADRYNSILLYGDNGTGKSSFLDAIEWFISDKVEHLSGDGVKKHASLRHVLSRNDEESFVEIKFTSNIGNKKNLEIKNNKPKVSFEKTSDDFTALLDEFKNEKLWIRNDDLADFIIKTKADRLADVSKIIGYEQVTKIKSSLKSSLNKITKEIQNGGFENYLSSKKNQIAQNLSETVNNEEQFYSAVNKLIPDVTVKDEKTFEDALKNLKESVDEKKLAFQQSLRRHKKENYRFFIGSRFQYIQHQGLF